MKMRILVTGANGFIGAALCKRLIERGDEVRGLVRETSDLSLLDNIPLHRHVGSLSDGPALQKAAEKVDLVYHAAAAVSDWGSWEYFRKVNVEGTRNILEAAIRAGVRRFVFVSSVAVHSFIGARGMDENSPQYPIAFPYCQTKREAEALVLTAHRQKKISATIVRPGDVFGPGDRTSLLKMASLLEKGKMAYIGGGRTLGAFTYIENLVEGLILAGTHENAAGQTYIMTDGIRLTWREYFEKLTAALEVPRPAISIHPIVAYSAACLLEWIYHVLRSQSRPRITRYLIAHASRDFHFSIEKARSELGYEPRIGIDEAIKRTAAWYKHVVRGN
jgi:nucleoside-diphosphate-sugar epimerase